MNRLARNLAYFTKNQHKPSAVASFVCSKALKNSENVRLFRKFAVQSHLFEKKNRLNALTIQIIPFSSDAVTISQLDYEHFCAETLDSLCDYFEELIEESDDLSTADIVNKDGVLTVSLGSTHGIYVINKQSPNKQIWLSSPTSGPKRFDFMFAADNSKTGFWIYKHTGETLHKLLDQEFSAITHSKTKFQSLAFGSKC